MDVLGIDTKIRTSNSAAKFYLLDRENTVYSDNDLSKPESTVEIFKSSE